MVRQTEGVYLPMIWFRAKYWLPLRPDDKKSPIWQCQVSPAYFHYRKIFSPLPRHLLTRLFNSLPFHRPRTDVTVAFRTFFLPEKIIAFTAVGVGKHGIEIVLLGGGGNAVGFILPKFIASVETLVDSVGIVQHRPPNTACCDYRASKVR